jgi:ribosomal protein S18 acetylase RimI-like enzyme
MSLLEVIKSPIIFSDLFCLQHPKIQDLTEIIQEIQREDLDLRRLKSTRNDSYESKGKVWLEEEWKKSLLSFSENFPTLKHERDQIFRQKNGILEFQEIPPSGFRIEDPFNLKPVEMKKNIRDLKNDQLQNSIVVKNGDELIAFGRLLDVEGSVEIVSLWTKFNYRRRGIGGKVIKELLNRSKRRPIFSFQTPNLIPYYLKQYKQFSFSSITLFNELPKVLQRDLFRMNIFWGPNTIIKID